MFNVVVKELLIHTCTLLHACDSSRGLCHLCELVANISTSQFLNCTAIKTDQAEPFKFDFDVNQLILAGADLFWMQSLVWPSDGSLIFYNFLDVELEC